MEKSPCVSCQNSKANLVCSGCQEALCKSCAQFVDETTFAYANTPPGNLVVGAYCIQCFDSKVQPEIAAYEEKAEQARNLPVFMKTQGKEVRWYKRAQLPVTVEVCEDNKETLLRLAFQTVEQGYDTLIGVELIPKKTRNGSYLKTVWSGTGIPATRHRRSEKE